MLSAMIVTADDTLLVDAARRGDLDAFEVLVRRYQEPVYRVALRMLGSESDAQDAGQDAFIRAWRSLAGFRGDSGFATWLYRIVTNRCLNMLAARRPVEPLTEAHTDPRADPAEIADRRDRFRAVADSILALPPEQRAALVLREFQGLTYEEVAEVLGVSPAAVKGRIHRARLAVAERLGR
jgi:RNA polymerase sigma-70 factor, ECF subfamily